MIIELHVRNFQPHKDTHVLLSPGMNVFVGSSHSGKSSLIRSIFWAVFNRPAGDSVCSWWGGETSVEIVTDAGKVERVKGKGVNEYRIDGRVLKAFGSTPPEDVTKLLNLGPINFQKQLSPHFLLASTPGEVGKRLNEVVNLTIIDRAIAFLSQKARSAKAAISEATAKVLELGKRCQGLEAAITQLDTDVGELEKLEKEHIAVQRSSGDLRTLLGALRESRKRLEYFAPIASHEQELKALSDNLVEYEKVAEDGSALKSLLIIIRQQRERREEAETELKELVAQYVKLVGEECPLCGAPVHEEECRARLS